MKIISYTEARENLRKEIDIVEETNEPTFIKSLNNQVVMISMAEYEKLTKKKDVDNEQGI